MHSNKPSIGSVGLNLQVGMVGSVILTKYCKFSFLYTNIVVSRRMSVDSRRQVIFQLFLWIADDRSKKLNFFNKKKSKFKFLLQYLGLVWKMHQMSTKNPSIGLVVLEIAPFILRAFW